ncbi:MAG: hypothetical protein H6742_07110 [Alphaproteobacteria bacterium]|nr:hypothetical protein [Alphaproteobacteria bacterium]
MPVVYVFEGVGVLHKSFFANPEVVAELSSALGGTLSGNANVYVRYDSKDFVGSIRLRLLPDSLQLPVAVQGDTVDLAALAPITRALAGMRSDVAGRFDVRLDSFSVGIESYRGSTVCVFSVAGQPPPDGSIVSPCVEINGQQVCGTPGPTGVSLPADAAQAIRSCLDR